MFHWTAVPIGMKEVINLMVAKPASVRFFVISISPVYLLYYRRASSTDSVTPTTAFKSSSEADLCCCLMTILTPVVFPAILLEFDSQWPS